MNYSRAAIIDIGSNSIKLLIAKLNANDQIESDEAHVEETRIGEGMSGNPPSIDANSIEKCAQAIARLLEKTDATCAIQAVATAAVREAANRKELVSAVKARTNLDIRILSGDEEATYIGLGLREDPSLSHFESFNLLDLGGGSLECIQFSKRSVIAQESLPLGSVRLAARCVLDRISPLSATDKTKLEHAVLSIWKASSIAANAHLSETAVVTGGSAAILGRILEKKSISIEHLEAFENQTSSHSADERISSLGIPESRADIFPTALLTLRLSLAFLGCSEIVFSNYNLRYGLAAETLRSGSETA